MNNSLDPYYKKTISFKYEGEELTFNVSQELFSSQAIDYGTQRLLRTLSTENINKFNKALDLGCGYGPIGIALKKLNPKSVIHMTDRDALALEYSRQNANLNNNLEVKIYSSLGYDSIDDTDFDLIISNIPAKVGEQVLSHMLLDAEYHLRPNGLVATVVIDAISEYVIDTLKSRDDIEILFQKSWPGHTVLHYKFTTNQKTTKPKGTGFSRGIYDRTVNEFSFNNEVISLKTTYNLPEFDTCSFDTKLLLDSLSFVKKDDIQSVIVINPGQGYIPIAISKLYKIKKIILVDRNLQSLKVSERNLILNNYLKDKLFLSHQVGILLKEEKQVDLIIGIIPKKQSQEIYQTLISQSVQQLRNNGLIMFASSSSVMFKIEKIMRSNRNLTILQKKKALGKKIIIAKFNI